MRNTVLLALIAVIACVGVAYAGTVSDFYRLSGSPGPPRTEVTIGEGNELARTPVDFYWLTSLYQVLYYASELPETPMRITSLKLYNNFSSTDVLDKPLRIWLGNTRTASLADDWVSGSGLSLVFDGIVSFPAGQNTITIPLDTPFQYSATYNLVMMVFRPMDDEHYTMSDKFKAQTDSRLRVRYITSDSEEINPASPPATTHYTGQYPQISFLMELSYDSLVSGVISNESGQGLEGVQISLNGGEFETSTNQYGYYQFEGMGPGDYQVLLQLAGYQDLTDTFTLDGIDDLVKDYVMQEKQDSNDANVQVPRLLKVYPNPFKQGCKMSYELPKAARVKIAVYNLRGQLIRQLKDEPQSSGSYTIGFEGHDLPAGIYLIRTQIGNQFHTGRILKL